VAVGVSRQTVSKWENGTSDPSTANLIALAKLYGVSAEELLKEL
jgi:transcriptional regulator with XRE-family HTH domain